jgi:hypothetical protein
MIFVNLPVPIPTRIGASLHTFSRLESRRLQSYLMQVWYVLGRDGGRGEGGEEGKRKMKEGEERRHEEFAEFSSIAIQELHA